MGVSLSRMWNTNDDPETIWQQVDQEFQSYAQKCNSVDTEPEDPIPQKCQTLAIPDYNQPTEPEMNPNLKLSDQDIMKIIAKCEEQNKEYMFT